MSVRTVNVFISNYSENYDVRPALDHVKGGGKLIPITRGTINIFKTDALVNKINDEVKDMNDVDWLLLTGNTIVSSMITAKVYEMFGKLNLLLWDARKQGYAPRNIVLDRNNLIDELNEPRE